MKKYTQTTRLRPVTVAWILAALLCNHPMIAWAESETQACIETAKSGLLDIPEDRSKRFLGKVQENTARCRGGEKAVQYRDTPWVDWQNYYATGDANTKHKGREAITKLGEHLYPNGRGIDGALLDLEYQRIELIKFNLFDQDTFEQYTKGRDGLAGPVLKYWDEMRLPLDHINYQDVGGMGNRYVMVHSSLIEH